MSKVGEVREKKTKTGGRQKGTPNKSTALLKDAILLAAENVGKEYKPKAESGLVSYLENLAADEKKAFSVLLGKVLPTQINLGDEDEPTSITFNIVRPES